MKFTEATLESAVVELFGEVGYQHEFGENLSRDSRTVVLRDDLANSLATRFANFGITQREIDQLIQKLELVPTQNLYSANHEIWRLVSNGFVFKRDNPEDPDFVVTYLDFLNSQANIFKIVTQFEVKGLERRIPDAVIFVNGIPLGIIEFKSAIADGASLREAHTQITTRYKRDIPELLKFNYFTVLCDGANTRVGSLFSAYDFFYAWRKVDADSAPSQGVDSLFTMVQGLFAPERLLSVIQDFVMFPDAPRGEEKYLCRYPQYFAATGLFNSINSHLKPFGDGKGGTYFGATGSGKSLTMVYLSRLLMRSQALQNPTILIVTDRMDLDEQLSKLFLNSRTFLGEQNVTNVESRQHLRELLSGIKSGGIFLTTVQKFTEDTELLTDRNNVICISDEAHRSQINLNQKVKISDEGVAITHGFAKYLHDSLPNATYVGVTGTPVDGTLEVFGPVTEAYTIRDSVEDQITVPIFYEGRAARVNLDEGKLSEIEEFYEQCAVEGSNPDQIEKSKRATTRLDLILGDSKRINLIAKDFVEHYELRLTENVSTNGKALFVASNRINAYNFYKELRFLRPEWFDVKQNSTLGGETSQRVKLVMTRNKDDDQELYDLLGSPDDRKELDRQFKLADSNFKIAIVVDMWLTGFDVPDLDVIYIDKPIQKHSLIQTISRVNRVHPNKEVGLVVDYLGLKQALNEAILQYGGRNDQEVVDVAQALTVFFDQMDLLRNLFVDFDNSNYFAGSPLEKLKTLNAASEYCQRDETEESRFKSIFRTAKSAFSICSASPLIDQAARDVFHFYAATRSLLAKITVGDSFDASQMSAAVTSMIHDALISQGIDEVLTLNADQKQKVVDLFASESFAAIERVQLPNTKIKLMQKLLEGAISKFRQTNLVKSVDFTQRLREIIFAYNDRNEFQVLQSHVLDELAERLSKLFEELRDEQKLSDKLGVSYEERAFFDILKAISEKYDFAFEDQKLTMLAKRVKEVVDDKSRYTDWAKKSDVKAELRVDLILLLDEFGYPPVPKDEIFREIFEQAENFKRHSI